MFQDDGGKGLKHPAFPNLRLTGSLPIHRKWAPVVEPAKTSRGGPDPASASVNEAGWFGPRDMR